MRHAELVTRAAAWLRNKQRCKVVLTETSAGYDAQVPDAIGWTWRGDCFEIECKASLSDFHADHRKPHRQPGAPSLGSRRYYLLPMSFGVRAVPEGWGLLLAQKRGLLSAIPAPPNTSRDQSAEAQLLVAVLARYQAQGLSYLTLREQHAAKLARYAADRERGLYYGAEAEAQALMGRLGMR